MAHGQSFPSTVGRRRVGQMRMKAVHLSGSLPEQNRYRRLKKQEGIDDEHTKRGKEGRTGGRRTVTELYWSRRFCGYVGEDAIIICAAAYDTGRRFIIQV